MIYVLLLSPGAANFFFVCSAIRISFSCVYMCKPPAIHFTVLIYRVDSVTESFDRYINALRLYFWPVGMLTS